MLLFVSNELCSVVRISTNLHIAQHKQQVVVMEQLFQTQLQEHKAQLEQANRLQRSQLEEVQRQLRQSNQQLDQAVTDNEKLGDDVLAKTQQVKQYKKQVDGLKAAAKEEVRCVFAYASNLMG